MPSAGATLTVTRNLPTDVQLRQTYVSLDGAPLATLVFGESVTREIEYVSATCRSDGSGGSSGN
ncbi:MAG TPA: hypothetical protein VES67_14980 [Vicinamibacterales bacterium]|nr:hypothetical protein [Vicinamibacterales bacterium]